jgi:branched-chain amino acid transport system permease protein
MTRKTWLLALGAAVVLVALPTQLGLGWQNTLISMLVASLFAASFNLLMGQAGMLSFGHGAFYGIGAFAVLHMMKATESGLGFPTPLLPLIGGLAGLALGLVAGFFATMRSGVYFSLVTLALAEMLHALAPNWKSAFGGESGLSSMRMPAWGLSFATPLQVYYLTLIWVVLCLVALYAYIGTPMGQLTLALRDNERRVRFLGFDAHVTKTLVFGISGLFSGVAGGLMALSAETVNYGVFSTHVSAMVVMHVFVGGSALFLGPVLGASLLTLFTFLASEATRAWLLYQGLIFVLVMLYAPNGLAGALWSHWRHRARLDWRRLAAPYLGALAGAALAALAAVFAIQVLEQVFNPAYRAAALRSGQWAAVSALGVTVAPTSPLPWAGALALFAAGIALLRWLHPIIAGAWSESAGAGAKP